MEILLNELCRSSEIGNEKLLVSKADIVHFSKHTRLDSEAESRRPTPWPPT
jgi:hypothetical protein